MNMQSCSIEYTKLPRWDHHLAGVASLMSRPKTPTDALKASCHSPASFFVCSFNPQPWCDRKCQSDVCDSILWCTCGKKRHGQMPPHHAWTRMICKRVPEISDSGIVVCFLATFQRPAEDQATFLDVRPTCM